MSRTIWLTPIVLVSCALTSKAPPVELRYFSPELGLEAAQARSREPPPAAERPALKLGRISSSSHLRHRIARRVSPIEVETYDLYRWTELPEDYMERTLSRELFDERGVGEAVGPGKPRLEVELLAFEEVKHDGKTFGRVQIGYSLFDARNVLLKGAVTIERETSPPHEIEDVVRALGSALDAASSEVADKIAAKLESNSVER